LAPWAFPLCSARLPSDQRPLFLLFPLSYVPVPFRFHEGTMFQIHFALPFRAGLAASRINRLDRNVVLRPLAVSSPPLYGSPHMFRFQRDLCSKVLFLFLRGGAACAEVRRHVDSFQQRPTFFSSARIEYTSYFLGVHTVTRTGLQAKTPSLTNWSFLKLAPLSAPCDGLGFETGFTRDFFRYDQESSLNRVIVRFCSVLSFD